MGCSFLLFACFSCSFLHFELRCELGFYLNVMSLFLGRKKKKSGGQHMFPLHSECCGTVSDMLTFGVGSPAEFFISILGNDVLTHCPRIFISKREIPVALPSLENDSKQITRKSSHYTPLGNTCSTLHSGSNFNWL